MRAYGHLVILTCLLATSSGAVAFAGPDEPAKGAEASGASIPTPVEIAGVMRKHPSGATTVAPESAAGSVIHLETGNLRTEALDNLPVVLNVLRAAPGQPSVVSGVRLQPVAEWDRITHLDTANLRVETLQSVARAVDQLRQTTQFALRASASTSAADLTRELQERSRNLGETLISAFIALKPDQESERQLLIETYGKNRQLGKAFYDEHDNQYAPAVYPRIYNNSRSGVALVQRGRGQPFCSGVLIAPSAVLTAQHCLALYDPTDLDVWINYETGLNDQPLQKHVYRVTKQLAYGNRDFDPDGPDLDFALLEIGPEADGSHAGDHWHPACLSNARVLVNDPLYVIGHPQGRPRMIADNAFVLFPFEVGPREYAALQLTVEAELKDDANKSVHLKEFKDSYRPFLLADGSQVYRNYSVLWDKQPTIGADSDTFHGNSGSPVFNRRNNLIVGILHDGQQDVSRPYNAGWQAHEAIVPISRIVQQLDKGLPQWRQQLSVCISD